jgi:hypothetical protein
VRCATGDLGVLVGSAGQEREVRSDEGGGDEPAGPDPGRRRAQQGTERRATEQLQRHDRPVTGRP